MALCDETISFLIFVLIGMLFSIIFDFFRAIRKLKKPKSGVVYIQDILYFLIIGVVLLLTILNMRMSLFRLYLILAIILGIVIYISFFGNAIMNMFFYILKMSNAIFEFIFLPINLYLSLFDKQTRKIKKYVARCCKKISYMIEFYHRKVKSVVEKSKNKLKTKERRGKYDKSGQANC